MAEGVCPLAEPTEFARNKEQLPEIIPMVFAAQTWWIGPL
jgi:hypothetical protein